MQDYTLQDLKDAVRQAVADDKAAGSNRVTAALIAELPQLVQGLLVHAYRPPCGVRTSRSPGTRPLSG